jgi:glycosyltransferase involved in cell wall biosynthesis
MILDPVAPAYSSGQSPSDLRSHSEAALIPPIRSPVGIAAGRSNHRHRIRVLYSVGHLLRGGIEMWLYQVVQHMDPSHFEHHILVRTDKEEPFTEAFRKIGAKVIPCLNYKRPVKYARNLRRVIQHHGPYDILHLHGSNPNGLLALLFAKPLGIPTRVVHSHNDIRPLLRSRGLAYRSYVTLTLLCLRFFADRGFAASVPAAESMFGLPWKTDKRWNVLHCGVEFGPFEIPADPNLRKRAGASGRRICHRPRRALPSAKKPRIPPKNCSGARP